MNERMVRAVDRDGTAVGAYDSDGQLVNIGQLVTTTYEDAQKRVKPAVLEFVLAGEDEDGNKRYSLGQVSENWNVWTPQDIIEPLLDEGFQMRKLAVKRGGLDQWALLSHPGHTYPDPNVGGDGAALELSIALSFGLGKGHGLRGWGGFFRIICINGLVSASLGYGGIQLTHAHGVDGVQAWATDMIRAWSQTRDAAFAYPMGLAKVIDGLNALVGQEVPTDVVNQWLAPLSRWPGEARTALVTELDKVLSAGDVTNLKLLNAITNVEHAANLPAVRTTTVDRLLKTTKARPEFFIAMDDITGMLVTLAALGEVFFTKHEKARGFFSKPRVRVNR